MARHKQPREVAELKGAHKKNPQRYRSAPPKNDKALGKPPTHLSLDAKNIWFELQKIAPPGVLTASERIAFEMLSNLLAEYRAKPAEFPTGKYSHVISLLARLGMTAADRQRLGIRPDDNPEKDEFKDF